MKFSVLLDADVNCDISLERNKQFCEVQRRKPEHVTELTPRLTPFWNYGTCFVSIRH